MAPKSRSQLMEEINRVDSQINELIAQMPPPPSAQVVPFPWGFWILAVLFIGGAAYDSGALLERVHPIVADYRVPILIIGSVLGLYALFITFKSLSHISFSSGRYKHINKKIEQLRRERGFLAQQLGQMNKT